MDFNFLNSPEFGAFGGAKFNLAQEKGRLENIETLGKIAAQPGEAALKAAHARAYNADAAAKEMESLGARSLGGIIESVNSTLPATATPAERLMAVGDAALNSGLLKPAKDAYESSFGIKLKEQQAATAKSNQVLHELDARRKQVEQDGSLAQFMLQGPEQYEQGKLFLASQKQDVSAMPADFAAARPQLQAIVGQSLTAKDQIEIERKRIEDEDQARTRGVQRTLDVKRSALADVRADVARADLADRKKNDGEKSPSVARRRDALTEADKAKREAALRKEFPPLPVDPKVVSLERGKNGYKLPDGRLVFAVGKDAQGRPLFKEAQ